MKREPVAELMGDLENIQKVILGLHELLSAIPDVRDNSRASAVTCAMTLYIEMLAEFIDSGKELVAGEGA